MLRAKAVSYRRGEVKLRDRLITRTDLIGRFASLPVVVNAVNAANRSRPLRAALDAGGRDSSRGEPASLRFAIDPAKAAETSFSGAGGG